eukprot:CAMPEP_0119330420 /NCGR_PEP_ID=MMETSP1333-20130426/78223_1 /TAXON_ID=418940 /ORGANISM="Scyphosphaera apsteinii, Strain RCC1455" /LENGTH=124 /DNA_ID=CAMNT_0007339805 /DNA_START=368 /DNA_END=742 /DNA_ORIENTATION=+
MKGMRAAQDESLLSRMDTIATHSAFSVVRDTERELPSAAHFFYDNWSEEGDWQTCCRVQICTKSLKVTNMWQQQEQRQQKGDIEHCERSRHNVLSDAVAQGLRHREREAELDQWEEDTVRHKNE